MNTIEKRKIESVINSEIKERVKAYENKREQEYNELKEKFEKQPPKEICDILTLANRAHDQLNNLEAKAKKLGWNLYGFSTYNNGIIAQMESSYDYDRKGYTHHAKELREHQAQTEKTINALRRLGRDYTFKIYAGSEEMQAILESFEIEISKLLK